MFHRLSRSSPSESTVSWRGSHIFHTYLRQYWPVFPLTALLLPTRALAVLSLYDAGKEVGLGGAKLPDVLKAAISWALGLLGLAAVSMIIYGGIIWMTAAGVEERINKAKKILEMAIVGLIIILLALAIVILVAGSTRNAILPK